MSVMESLAAEVEVASVAFVPASERPAPSPPDVVRLPAMPLVERLLEELRQPLAGLARRARRVGPRDGAAVLLLAGCRREVGCSTVAAALAVAAADERPVLLIDADLERAGLSTRLAEAGTAGWEQAVWGPDSVGQSIRYLTEGRLLSFLPLKPPGKAGAEIVKQPTVHAWLARLRREYGLIVLDGGPLENSGDWWASVADAALLVCDAEHMAGYDWPGARDSLEAEGTTVLGVVETFADGAVGCP